MSSGANSKKLAYNYNDRLDIYYVVPCHADYRNAASHSSRQAKSSRVGVIVDCTESLADAGKISSLLPG